MDTRPKKKKRYDHLTIGQSIALLPLEFGNPTKLKEHIYNQAKETFTLKVQKGTIIVIKHGGIVSIQP